MIDIPNYEIGRLAGRGGVAEVYLARHKLLDRIVAIKVISAAKAGDTVDKRFLKEARVVAGLRHPNIVSIYDVGVLDNKYYIIMEYLDGGDLKELSKNGLSVARSFRILKQLAAALAHAHDKGFIHRDIKSQNVMFRSDGTAVLTDFGIVKDLTADTGYTLDGTSVGTPHYMSPEQAQGSSDIDWRTDLYSLGVTFYEMLTGTVPYSAETPVAVALKHIKAPVPRLPEHLSRYQFIIDRLMAKKPEKRFQSAHDLLGALDRQVLHKDEDTPTETIAFSDRSALRSDWFGPGIRVFAFVLVLAVIAAISGFWIYAKSDRPLHGEMPAANRSEPSVAGDSEKTSQSEPANEHEALPEPSSSIRQEERVSLFPENPADPGGGIGTAPPLFVETLEKGEYQAAREGIEALREQFPRPAGEMFEKAADFQDNGRLEEAADIYNAIYSVDSKNQLALLGLLSVAVTKQEFLENADAPTVTEYEDHLEFLAEIIEDTDVMGFKQLRRNTLGNLHDTARDFFDSGKIDRALEFARVGLEYAPDHLRLRKLELLCRARMNFKQERMTLPEGDNALDYYQQVLALDAGDPDAAAGIQSIVEWYTRAARGAYEATNHDRALQYISRALAIDPENAEAEVLNWRIRGARLYEKGQYEKPKKNNAGYYYRKALEQDPQNEAIALDLARTEVLGALSAVGQEKALKENLPYFRKALQRLETATAAHGRQALADVRKTVAGDIKAAIQAGRDRREEIPEDFNALVEKHLPEFFEEVNTRYEALIAKGDEQQDLQQRADFYLEALAHNPERSPAREKIETVAREMDDNGNPNGAAAVLKSALDMAPEHSGFKQFFQTLQAARDAKAELFTQLYQIKLIQPFSKKIAPYRQFFSDLESAAAGHGRDQMRDPRQDAIEQIKDEIQAMKSENQLIPGEFIEVITSHLPELEKFILDAQYDIIIKKAENAVSFSEKADYYIEGLKLNPNRTAASEAIQDLARRMDKNGDNPRAVAILERAKAAAPSNGMIAELYDRIYTEIEIYPTRSGCGRENRIAEVPVTTESLSLCLQYRNMAPSSIVQVILSQEGGQAMEIPVVLEEGSSRQSIRVAAPVEGFSTGEYSIVVRQDDRVLQESRIQFIPKRR